MFRRVGRRRLSAGGGLGVGNVRGTREQLLQEGGVGSVVAPWFVASPASIAMVGAPQQFGQPLAGTHRGPELLRRAGVREMLGSLGWRVIDAGDVDMSLGSSRSGVIAGSRNLFERARAFHEEGRLVLSVGGDHSIALGSVGAALAARPETRVLWVDAHADVNTPETSPTGNMHGMPLAYLLGLAADERLDWISDLLAPDRLAYVALRDVDAAERPVLRALRDRGAFVSTMHEVDQWGIGAVMDRALRALGYADDDRPPPLHLSYDIDAIDPQFASATGTVVRGGLTFREAHYVCEAVWATRALGSMDIVEVNDTLTDPARAQETVDLAASLVASACGDVIL